MNNDLILLYLLVCALYGVIRGIDVYTERELDIHILDVALAPSLVFTITTIFILGFINHKS